MNLSDMFRRSFSCLACNGPPATCACCMHVSAALEFQLGFVGWNFCCRKKYYSDEPPGIQKLAGVFESWVIAAINH